MAAEKQRTSSGFNSDHQYTEATVSQIQSVPSPTNNSLMKNTTTSTQFSSHNMQAVPGSSFGLMGPPASNVPLSSQRIAAQQPQYQQAGQPSAQLGGVIAGSGNNSSDIVQPVANIFNPTSQIPASRQPTAYQSCAYQPGSLGGAQGVSGGTATLFSPQQHNPFGGQTYTGYGGVAGSGFGGFANNSVNQPTAPQDLSPANQFAQMIQMLASGFNSTQQPSSRDPETRMARALEELRANPVQVPAGIDDRFENLHIGRFLGGAVTNQQRKWLIARELYGLTGITPLTGYDLDTIGIAGCVTTRGILEIQNPANPNMKLKYFSSTNVGSAALSSRRLTLAEGDHAVDINESLRDLVHMADFTMALTCPPHFCPGSDRALPAVLCRWPPHQWRRRPSRRESQKRQNGATEATGDPVAEATTPAAAREAAVHLATTAAAAAAAAAAGIPTRRRDCAAATTRVTAKTVTTIARTRQATS